MTGLRRVDSLAARCLMSRGRNKRAMVSRQKQEYQRQSRDVNNTRQGSRSQAQVQSSKVGQSGVKHRDSRMNRRTLRNVTRGKQDFALGECLCAAFMWVREWGAGVVRQSELMSEWWQLCDWCNGGRECVSAVHDGKCSPWVMCSLSEWEPDSWQSPPPKSGFQTLTQSILQEGGGAEVEPGEGMEGQVHVGPMRQEPTRAGRRRQQRREVTLGKLLWREVTLAGRRRREVTLAGRRRREVTLAGRRRREVTLAGRRRREVTLAGRRRREVTLAGRRRLEVTLAGRRRREVTLAGRRRREVTLAGQAPTRAEQR